MTARAMTRGGPPHGSPVPSPCIDVCTMDAATGWCAGCLRTLDEIAAWGVLDDGQKREVWQWLAERRATPEGRALVASAGAAPRGATRAQDPQA